MTNLSAKDSAAGLRTYLRMMQAWLVDDRRAIAILDAPESTFYRWRDNPEQAQLSGEQIKRISYVFGIYKRLQVLLPDPEIADSWVSTPNAGPLFGGRSPLDLMSSGRSEELRRVHDYLEAEM